MNINETRDFIAACDLTNTVPLIQGVHGLGKSDIVRQYAKDNDLHCEVLILSLMDVGDLCGLPRTVSYGGQLSTTWSAPIWFNRIIDAAWPVDLKVDDLTFDCPELEESVKAFKTSSISREQLNSLYCRSIGAPDVELKLHVQSKVHYKYSKRSVLFLDEFNRAPGDILNTSLQLILDRRLNDFLLPIVNGKPTYVVAAVNPSNDNYTVNTMDPALLDRFVFGTVEPDAKTWLDWARKTDQAQVVRDFIAEHPARIHYVPADNSTGATPRSWASLSKIMKTIDKIPSTIHFQLIKGTVGSEVGAQFFSYYNNYSKVVRVEEIEAIVKNKIKTTSNPEEIATPIKKLIKSQEVIQRIELAEQLWSKYIEKSATDALPLVAFLYALENEELHGFLVTKKKDDMKNYMNLSKLDETLNNKQLFRKLAAKINTKA